ncbi:hypothetical protein [Thermomonospora cellulosilytica]|uniref:Uncharacterized protein n=1 Tax=Thermomonospora cellulosilytica TaxID=1411118 RepID=A0A7W3RA14_9ACTN|nr:hypothetical protein [Thermomonospora cellulosilytica]MBA9005923.1 hypothetical protein [Thermomonospora cellulosilytica]
MRSGETIEAIRDRARHDHPALLAGFDATLDVLARVRQDIERHLASPQITRITALQLGYLRGSGTVAGDICRALYGAFRLWPTEGQDEDLPGLLGRLPDPGLVIEVPDTRWGDQDVLAALENLSLPEPVELPPGLGEDQGVVELPDPPPTPEEDAGLPPGLWSTVVAALAEDATPTQRAAVRRRLMEQTRRSPDR